MNDEASPRVEPSRDISSEYFELKEQIHHDCIEHLNLAAFDKRLGHLPGVLNVGRVVEIEHVTTHDLLLLVAGGGRQRPVAVDHAARVGIDDREHVRGKVVEASVGGGRGLRTGT